MPTNPTFAQWLAEKRAEVIARDDTAWHVLAQDISHHWSHPEEVAIAYQAASKAFKAIRNLNGGA